MGRAESAHNRCLKHKPEFTDAYELRSLLRLRLGREAAAQADFEQCLKLNPQHKAVLEMEMSKVKKLR